jgi:hypothetical protein
VRIERPTKLAAGLFAGRPFVFRRAQRPPCQLRPPRLNADPALALSPWALSAQMPGSSAGRVSVISAPRLHRERIPRHDDEVGERAAAARAAKLQVLYRHIAPPDSDDGPQVSGRLMVAGRAPDPFFARGRPWFAGWWRRQCFLVPNRPRVVAVPSRAYASFARQF